MCVFDVRIQPNPVPVIQCWVPPMRWQSDLMFNQHTRYLSRLRSAAHTKWNVFDDTFIFTPLIRITRGQYLSDLGWYTEEPGSLLCNRGGCSLMPKSAEPQESFHMEAPCYDIRARTLQRLWVGHRHARQKVVPRTIQICRRVVCEDGGILYRDNLWLGIDEWRMTNWLLSSDDRLLTRRV